MDRDDDRPPQDAQPTSGLWRELRALPRPAPAPLASARIHGRARRLFLASAPAANQGWTGALRARVGRLYARVEPALATAVVLVYLGWAIETVLAIRR